MTLVGGPGDGRVVHPEAGTRQFLAAGYESPDAKSRELIVYRRETVGFIMPGHLESFVTAALGDLELERRELVDMATGSTSIRLDVDVWATEERLDAIRVELSLVDKALGPLAFVELYDDTPFAERLKQAARERLEALAELMSPGHT